jgi:hypothetical protein
MHSWLNNKKLMAIILMIFLRFEIFVNFYNRFPLYKQWASADFFPGGGRTYFMPKKQQIKILYFQKKSKNILYLPSLERPGGGAKAPCGRPYISCSAIFDRASPNMYGPFTDSHS